MLLGIPNLLNVQVINGLEIYTFKSEKIHGANEAIIKTLDALKNKEFYPVDENLNRIEKGE